MFKNEIKRSLAQALLFESILNSSLEQVRQAIMDGADINAIADDFSTVQQGQTSLFIASYIGDKAIVELLLTNGANVNQPTGDGSTPLMSACQQGHLAIVDLLLKHGTETNLSDNDGETPLFVAAGSGHKKIVALLLDHGAQINSTNLNARSATPLFIACQRGHIKVVELLLTRGASIDQIRKSDNVSPLQVAAYSGHILIVKLLMKLGANIIHKNNDGLTASNLAQENGHEAIRDLLSSSMTYQENFIANTCYILFGWKKQFPIYTHEGKYINELFYTIKDISDADEVFKKLSGILKDTTSSDYIKVKEKLTLMRKSIISNMHKYNADKTNALKQSSSVAWEKSSASSIINSQSLWDQQKNKDSQDNKELLHSSIEEKKSDNKFVM